MKWIRGLLKAILTLTALTMDYGFVADDISLSGYENSETTFAALSKLLYAMDKPSMVSLLLIAFLTFFYVWLEKMEPLPKCTMAGIRIMALLASFCMIIGRLFYVYNDIGLFMRGTMQMLKGLLVLGGLFVSFSEFIRFAVSVYIKYCDRQTDMSSCKIFNGKYVSVVIAAGILAAWMPTIVAYYPAVFMGDSEDIIYMAYNYPSGLENTVAQIKEGIYVTNHHPVIYTAYVSLMLHVARRLGGSWNLGIFLCAAVQCLLTLCVLTYGCLYCARELKNGKLALVSALFYALFPIVPQYAIMISKDTFFADLLLLWAILMHKAVRPGAAGRIMPALIAVSAGIVFIRKNGIYIILLTLLVAIVLYKNLWKCWISAMIGIVVVSMLYSNIALPMMGIPDGSVREMLSVPFQQTARYVKYHADEVTEEEKQAISGVLDYDSLAESYSGNLSDPVKNTYNMDASGTELREYFVTWFKMLWKHPEEYAAAFFNNYYGYFYPVVNDGMKIARTSVGSMANVNRDGYFNFSYLYDSFHIAFRDALTFYEVFWMHIPVLNLFMTSALYVWIVMSVLLLKCIRRDRAAILSVVIYLALIFTVLVGPSNAIDYERYIFPCIQGMPFLMVLTFCENKSIGKGA